MHPKSVNPAKKLNKNTRKARKVVDLMDEEGFTSSSEMEESESSAKEEQLYKTEMCRSWSLYGSCRYGGSCLFAHGDRELRPVTRSKKYKTRWCNKFLKNGVCPYGKRCQFKHGDSGVPNAPSVVNMELQSIESMIVNLEARRNTIIAATVNQSAEESETKSEATSQVVDLAALAEGAVALPTREVSPVAVPMQSPVAMPVQTPVAVPVAVPVQTQAAVVPGVYYYQPATSGEYFLHYPATGPTVATTPALSEMAVHSAAGASLAEVQSESGEASAAEESEEGEEMATESESGDEKAVEVTEAGAQLDQATVPAYDAGAQLDQSTVPAYYWSTSSSTVAYVPTAGGQVAYQMAPGGQMGYQMAPGGGYYWSASSNTATAYSGSPQAQECWQQTPGTQAGYYVAPGAQMVYQTTPAAQGEWQMAPAQPRQE